MWPGLLSAWLAVLAAAAFAQAPAFDAASIKAAKSGVRGFSIRPLPGRLSATNVTLGLLVAEAYHVNDFQVIGGPRWLNSDRFDIEAKANGDSQPSQKELREMLKQLLADRFQLSVHHESKDLPVYVLAVARNGPKVRESKATDDPPYFRVFQRHQITSAHAPLEYLVEALTWIGGRTVIDKTGLTGKYDYQLEWTPDETQVRSDEAAPQVEGNLPSLTSALEEQMGLRLASQKGPVDLVVIDKADRPSVN